MLTLGNMPSSHFLRVLWQIMFKQCRHSVSKWCDILWKQTVLQLKINFFSETKTVTHKHQLNLRTKESMNLIQKPTKPCFSIIFKPKALLDKKSKRYAFSVTSLVIELYTELVPVMQIWDSAVGLYTERKKKLDSKRRRRFSAPLTECIVLKIK